MVIGVQKRQLVLLLLVVCMPTLLNTVGIWQYVGTASILKMWNGTYPNPFVGFLGGPYNPLPEIFLKLLLNTILPGLLSWLLVLMSNKAFFQKQPWIARLLETLVMVVLIAAIFAFDTGIIMPFIWLTIFRTSQGIPGDTFMINWSQWFVLPVTAVILLGAIFHSDKS
jgi:hypothetical protein